MSKLRAPAILAIALIVLFSGGCVSHIPISETVIFHDASTQPSHDRTSGFGFVGTYSPTKDLALDLAEREYPKWAYRKEDLVLNPNRLSGGGYFAGYDSRGRFAVSATVGALVAGMDATAQVWKRNYLTASVSAPGQGQVFAQHRAYNSEQVGAAVGVGLRRAAFTFDVPSECMCRIESTGVNSFGARGFAVLRAAGDRGGGIRVGVYAGYMPELKRPTMSVTLTAGRF